MLHYTSVLSDQKLRSFVGEIETEFENTLACLSGAQMGLNHEKNGGRKSPDTLPLTTFM